MSDLGEPLPTKVKIILSSSESVVYASMVTRATFGRTSIDAAWVILTTERFIGHKTKVFGTPKADISIPWSAVSRAQGVPWPVDFTKIELRFETDGGPLTVIDEPNTIYEVEVRGRSLYSRLREG